MEHLFIKIALLFVIYNNIAGKKSPIVETKNGFIAGKVKYSRNTRAYHSFRGIPFAKPPLGNLRFKAPEKAEKWSNVLDGTKDGPYCLQKTYLFFQPKVVGSEDCLYLNVYTPKISARVGLLPVMVFIHWGGFFTGYSSSEYLGPEYLMDRNIVLVTFNYRLGVLGFLSTNDDEAPGNYALKDQVMALKWVQNNIESFGGDKDKVTIFGQSAGGASVNFHMFSKESKNLFHQGISQSGTSLALWAKPLDNGQFELAKAQATLVGCNDLENSSKIIGCLRIVDAVDLVNSGDKFKFFSVDPLNVYMPSIEKKTHRNPRPFLTKQPIDYIRTNSFHKVPWIVGLVNDEGLIRAEPILRQTHTREILNNNFDDLMPNLTALPMSISPSNIGDVWSKIKLFYFGKTDVNITDPYNMQPLINLYTDRAFAYTSYQAALFQNIKGHDKIWFYHFNYSGQYSYGDIFAATNKNIDFKWGVSHCDDLLYIFRSPAIFADIENINDQTMIDTIVDLWTNFATYGNPTPPNAESRKTETWLKLNVNIDKNKTLNYLNIVGSYKDANPPKLYMKNGLFYEKRFQFWENLPLSENIEELNQTIHTPTLK